jgi:hypothetical protein
MPELSQGLGDHPRSYRNRVQLKVEGKDEAQALVLPLDVRFQEYF